MQTSQTMNSTAPNPTGFPDADELAMLRAWYAGMPVRKTVERYLPDLSLIHI